MGLQGTGTRIVNQNVLFILCNYYARMEVSSSDEELTHKSSGQTVVGILKLVPLSNFRSSLSIFRIFKHVARAQTSVINA